MPKFYHLNASYCIDTTFELRTHFLGTSLSNPDYYKIGFLLDFLILKTPNAKEQNNLLIHLNKWIWTHHCDWVIVQGRFYQNQYFINILLKSIFPFRIFPIEFPLSNLFYQNQFVLPVHIVCI
jgi:hypothetical protein